MRLRIEFRITMYLQLRDVNRPPALGLDGEYAYEGPPGVAKETPKFGCRYVREAQRYETGRERWVRRLNKVYIDSQRRYTQSDSESDDASPRTKANDPFCWNCWERGHLTTNCSEPSRDGSAEKFCDTVRELNGNRPNAKPRGEIRNIGKRRSPIYEGKIPSTAASTTVSHALARCRIKTIQ